ncbi:hypothetical protein GALMADRAFT_258854 [Galerina marginata CBS 339.88]|uniref:Uncharacterized protein n=1 Tax=Galerina marginata (strain CBS 339.88) TaxID=685588 RepID=A0A067S826_GALM3|nr:hypothetical protein GALMADRAFT_258854 [Galerina marginata CBS 339.88]
MRSFLSLSLAVLTAISGIAQAASSLDARSPNPQCVAEFCADAPLVKRADGCVSEICLDDYAPVSVKRQTISSPRFFRKELTNAQRLARGLPLKPPARRRASPSIAARDAQTSPVPTVTYTVVAQVFQDTTSLGFVAPDPNYWTPLLTPSIDSALRLSFSLPLGATSGSQLSLTMLNDNRGTYFAPVVGRDSTSSDLAAGSFNYLYLDPVAAPGTAAGATPQSAPSFFSTSSGLDKQTETSVWSVDLVSMTLTMQWINTDSSTPASILFVQSNHIYAGGDPDAFHSRFPAPVNAVTLKIVQVA